MANERYEILIIGGSAAASAAAVYAARREVNCKIITQIWGGEVAQSGSIGNYPGFNEINGLELSNKFRQQVEFNQISIEEGVWVEKIVKKNEGDFIITAQKNSRNIEYCAQAVIVATGVHPRQLNAVGESNLRGKGVSYCTTCDGPLFRGKTVAVIGGGNSALESALMLKELCPKVYLLTINDELMGETIYITKLQQADNVEIIYGSDTKQFMGANRLEAVEYIDKKSKTVKKVEVQGAFVHIGLVPNSNIVPEEVKKNKLNEIITNGLGETKVPGLFAAGDVTDIPFKQIAIACGQGVSAVLRAIQYLDAS